MEAAYEAANGVSSSSAFGAGGLRMYDLKSTILRNRWADLIPTGHSMNVPLPHAGSRVAIPAGRPWVPARP